MNRNESTSVQKSTLREAAQQALKVLESAEVDPHSSDAVYKAIADLRAALAEPVQEPVAWMHTNGVGHVYFRKKPQDKVFNPQPLYTARAIERAHGIGEKE